MALNTPTCFLVTALLGISLVTILAAVQQRNISVVIYNSLAFSTAVLMCTCQLLHIAGDLTLEHEPEHFP